MSSPSHSSDFSTQGSPQPELELDPSDPLNLLLRNSDSMDDSSAGGSPPDWSQFSTLWSSPDAVTGESNAKDFSDMVDFSMPLGSELDFTSQMAIDPHALHFDYAQKLGFNDFSMSNDLPSSQDFPFTFQSDLSPSNPPHERRLSVTSSSSSSGASLSPIVKSASVPSSLAPSESVPPVSLDPAAEELAERVRQSAGITLAVLMDHLQQNNLGTSMFTDQPSSMPVYGDVSSSSQSGQSSGSSTSSAASTPPPTTPPPSEPVISNLGIHVPSVNTYIGAGGSMGMIARPKTSHTTIERRYRTNLNARIMSLRMAVPALRVLEDKEGSGVGGGGKKGKGKNATLGKNVIFGSKVKKEGEDGEDVVDVIDDRGFVDGVKVARKCSKANVLGKAVEYIRVLKKRELRLKREQDGLKALVNSLVGGPNLLREWEREWKERFGGSEKDEVEGEDIDDAGSDDEGMGSGDEDDADDEGLRKRKKAKITPAKEKRPPPPPPQPIVLPDGSVVVPEKRKRGRPRKVVPPPVTAALVDPTPGNHSSVPQVPVAQPHYPQPAQYLLATFALFSFFNNPLSSSSPSHTPPNHSHTGTILTHNLPLSTDVYSTEWSWHDVAQGFHLLVSILVFSSILAPWLPSILQYVRSKYVSFKKVSLRPVALPKPSPSHLASLVVALSPSRRGTETEATGLRRALDGHRGIYATARAIIVKSKENIGFEQAGLEQRAWVRLGELAVLGGETSLLDRALTCWHMRSHLSWFTASAADLSTLALAMWPLGHFVHRHARSVWEAARARKGFSGVREGGVGVQVRPHERLVLENMTLEQAISCFRSPVTLKSQASEWSRYSPIGVLACILVKERVKRHLETMFVRTVFPSEQCYELEDGSANAANVTEDKEEEERRQTIEAARSLGGRMAELGDTLQRMWTMGVWELDDITIPYDESNQELDLDAEIRVLLNALILYRQIFSSSILGSVENGHSSGISILLSPPPSPVRQDVKLHYALRRVLGSSVFDAGSDNDNGLGGALEDARDRLVDMLVECERARRML
ncbi:hypothetical protein BDP27DRAFT_1325329 [Rhodocollybia butyracea]|uniref:BHLH domain-containing protein n=1 Tax=Rhodocollybia butyracea TaxID=206335 RepID=A0A9P5PU80_9AGAR|nr:hypothetical protein BDP27DRAFT_1325329 [Rhodocollybia butyracea]